MNTENRDKIIVRTSMTGILANVLLAAFKAVVGILTHSIAITLDAVNNLSDAFSSVVTIIGTVLANKKPDKDHPWGHGRAEYLSAMVISVIVSYAGFTSLIESVRKIISPSVPEYTNTALLIVAVGVLVKIILGRYVKKVGEDVGSESLIDSGQDALMDAVISTATLAAAFIYIGSGISLEAYLGAAISLIIIKAGIDMLRQTISELLGERVDIETAKKVKRILGSFPEVRGVYDLIFHDYGPGRLNCSAHIEVDDTLSAVDIDAIQRSASYKLYSEMGIVMTALSVYAINTRDPEVVELHKRIRDIVFQNQYVTELHGFYVKEDEVYFDIIINFDAPDRAAEYEKVCSDVKQAFKDRRFHIIMDTDFSG